MSEPSGDHDPDQPGERPEPSDPTVSFDTAEADLDVPSGSAHDPTLAEGAITDLRLGDGKETAQVVLTDDQGQPSDPTRSDRTGPTVVESDAADIGEGETSLDARIRRKLAESDARADGPDPMIGRTIVDRFTVIAKVGEGGMGAVYRATQRGMDREVAIKVLLGDVARNESVVRRFHLEALAISKLRHPNTIQIYDFGETDDGLLYIAMEYLEGTSLHGLLEFEGVLSARRAVRIARQMGRSLREAHQKGIVHRDLKPDNVFLISLGEERDFVKVLDFGVAKLREADGKGGTVTKTGTIFGTPRYMSPEQARGKTVDVRSDLYAIGVMLFQMLTGRVPFDADNQLGVLIQHIQNNPPAFEDVRSDLVVPTEVQELVYKLLSKRPEDRPQTAEAMNQDLGHIEDGLDEIFRRVVTREDAMKIGLEMAISARTRHDTRPGSAAEDGHVTVGPFQDATVAPPGEDGARPRRAAGWGRLAAAALGIGVVGALFLAPRPLPEGYRSLHELADIHVAAVPEMAAPMVLLTVASDPAEAEILAGTEPVGKTPLTLRRRRGSSPVTYTFRKEGYRDYTRTFEFDQDVTVTVPLGRILPPEPPPTRSTPRTGKTGAAKATPQADKVPAAKSPFEPGKVRSTKDNPYGP